MGRRKRYPFCTDLNTRSLKFIYYNGRPASTTPADPTMPTPPVPPPNQPTPQDLAAPQAHIGQQLLNWLHFRPEFAGKPEEDVEAHLLYTND